METVDFGEGTCQSTGLDRWEVGSPAAQEAHERRCRAVWETDQKRCVSGCITVRKMPAGV